MRFTVIRFFIYFLSSLNASAQFSPFTPPSLSSQPSACPEQHCKELTEQKICFMGYESKFSEDLKTLAYQKTCGWDAISFQTRTPEELKSAIDELGRSCVKIKTFTLASHGSPGAVYLLGPPAPPITVDNIKSTLGMISCWTEPGTEVVAAGCNVGAGCEGDNFLYQAAMQLIPQGGKVRGPTDLSATLFPGILPVMSLDGNKAQITYDPSKVPTMTWQNRGEVFGIETPREVTNQQCLTEILSTARALGPSGAVSAACSNQTDQPNRTIEVSEIIARIKGQPVNRFSSPTFAADASRFQAVQGAMYTGSFCSPQNATGIPLPASVSRPAVR
jgi:hypothetical protein